MKETAESKELTKSLARLIHKYRKNMPIDEIGLTIVRVTTYLLCLDLEHEKAAAKVVKVALEEGVSLYRATKRGV